MVSLEFFIHIILPAALWLWGRLGLQQTCVPGVVPGRLGGGVGEGGRCVGLTTLPPSCADCVEICESEPSGTPVGLTLLYFTWMSAWIFLNRSCLLTLEDGAGRLSRNVANCQSRLRSITGERKSLFEPVRLKFIIIIIIIIIVIRYGSLLSQAFSAWYFSWTSGDPTAQASSFTLQYFPYYVWCSKYSCLL